MLIFWVMGPHTGRTVTHNGGIANRVRIEGDKLTLNPYFYVLKYRSSDALSAPEIFCTTVLSCQNCSSVSQ